MERAGHLSMSIKRHRFCAWKFIVLLGRQGICNKNNLNKHYVMERTLTWSKVNLDLNSGSNIFFCVSLEMCFNVPGCYFTHL